MATSKHSTSSTSSKPATPKASKPVLKTPEKARKAADSSATKGRRPAPKASAKGKPAKLSGEDLVHFNDIMRLYLHNAAAIASRLCGIKRKFLYASFDGEFRRQNGVTEWSDLASKDAMAVQRAVSRFEEKIRETSVERDIGRPLRGGGPPVRIW